MSPARAERARTLADHLAARGVHRVSDSLPTGDLLGRVNGGRALPAVRLLGNDGRLADDQAHRRSLRVVLAANAYIQFKCTPKENHFALVRTTHTLCASGTLASSSHRPRVSGAMTGKKREREREREREQEREREIANK